MLICPNVIFNTHTSSSHDVFTRSYEVTSKLGDDDALSTINNCLFVFLWFFHIELLITTSILAFEEGKVCQYICTDINY